LTTVYRFGRFELHVQSRQLLADGQLVVIGARAFDLLHVLIEHRDRLVTKDELLARVWSGLVVEENNLQVQVSSLRRILGQHAIATIPGRGYRFALGLTHTLAESSSPTVSRTKHVARESASIDDNGPSIAVLPFQNLSGDQEQQYFADGMVDEIITALSRIRWLFVIAHSTSLTYRGQVIGVKQVGQELGVRYVLEGSVRRAGQRARITVQLLAATTGEHLWAERFDGSLENVFDFQNQVADNIAGIIEPTLQAAEICRSTARPTDDLTAYDLYLRSLPLLRTWRKEDYLVALGLLGEALKRDPHYGVALAMAARCQLALHSSGWSDEPESSRRSGIDLARRALAASTDDPRVLASAAFVLAYFSEDVDAAIELIDRALTLNPSHAWGWTNSGFVRLWTGQPALAIEHFDISLRLNPRADRAAPFLGIGFAHLLTRRFEDAKAMLLRSLQERPDWPPTYRYLASCYAHMGQLDAARQAVRQIRAITPVVLPSAAHLRNPEHRELFLSGLRLAAGEAD
jgi:adenylate cyclase